MTKKNLKPKVERTNVSLPLECYADLRVTSARNKTSISEEIFKMWERMYKGKIDNLTFSVSVDESVFDLSQDRFMLFLDKEKVLDERIKYIRTLLNDGGLTPLGIDIIMGEIQALIQKEREEAVRGFVEDSRKYTTYEFTEKLRYCLEQCLSQTKGSTSKDK
jgi:hypothetical protein